MKEKNTKHRHHIIPQFYLTYFVNENGMFYCYDKINEKIFLDRPKNVAFENDFYTVQLDDINEDYFENANNIMYETNFSKKYKDVVEKQNINLNRIINNDVSANSGIDIPWDDVYFLNLMLGYFISKNTSMRKQIAEMNKPFINVSKENKTIDVIKENNKYAKLIQLKKIFETDVNENLPLQFCKLFSTYKSVMLFSKDNLFITSDEGYGNINPIILSKYISCTGNVYCFPLNSHICHLLFEDDTNIKDRAFLAPKEMVDGVNFAILNNAKRQVFSCDKKSLECFKASK